jgi:hypothetical protein
LTLSKGFLEITSAVGQSSGRSQTPVKRPVRSVATGALDTSFTVPCQCQGKTPSARGKDQKDIIPNQQCCPLHATAGKTPKPITTRTQSPTHVKVQVHRHLQAPKQPPEATRNPGPVDGELLLRLCPLFFPVCESFRCLTSTCDLVTLFLKQLLAHLLFGLNV